MNTLSERPPETGAALAAVSRALFCLTGWGASGLAGGGGDSGDA
ncbi:MAG: hypothetical protein ACUVSX_10955 [Aggregatilineales bacterium]